MDHGPLVTEEIDAGADLVRQFNEYAPVVAAFWLKASDENQRYLYLASEEIKDTNIDLAYGELVRLAGKMGSTFLDLFRVKLINAADPLAKAVLEINQRYPGKLPMRFGGSFLGGIGVDDAYIYPSLSSIAAR